MKLFNLFKKKNKPLKENYEFNFDKFPELLKVYEKYRILELDATKYCLKNTASYQKKYEKASKVRDTYANTVLAKAIYNCFNEIKPTLRKRRGEEAFYKWEEIFDKPFENLNENQLKCLVGLIYRKFVYELPQQYYNN